MSLDHQDWTPVVLRKENKTKQIQHEAGFKQKLNIISDDPDPPKILGREAGQKILHARNAKKLTQANLAKQINVQANIIRDYETGNVIPNRRILNLICRKLEIQINYK